MPLTAKGEKILASLVEQYGSEKKAKSVLYAMKNAGKITGIDASVVYSIDELWGSAPQMQDAIALDFDDASDAKLVGGGYLRAMPKIARTGIQLYHGKECGRPDMEKVRVYRSPEAVFSPDAVNSYTHLPITLEHPGMPVSAANWKKHAVGETGDEVLRDGGTVRVPMMLRDAAAIKAVKDGKNQISVGYSCDLEWVDGVTPEGDRYDAVQTNIQGNHVAIVSTARGGPELKFGDKGDTAMELKTITIDGIACQMTDTASVLVQKLQDEFDLFKKKKKKDDEDDEEEKNKFKKKDAAQDAAIAVKDKEISDLQAQLKDALSPERLHQRVKDLNAVIDRATKIAGKPLKTDGLSDADIRRQVVDGKLGDVAKGWDDNKISAAFDAISVTTTPTKDNNGRGSIADAVRAFGGPINAFNGHPSGSNDPRDQAYYDSVRELQDAWKAPAK
jgi:hypothetical protein